MPPKIQRTIEKKSQQFPSTTCKPHKQTFSMICLHSSCPNSYKMICSKCKKQKHFQHPNRVISLKDFFNMLRSNKMDFIENSLGFSLVNIKNKLVYVSNFRIFILQKQSMLMQNSRTIHNTIFKILQQKKFITGHLRLMNEQSFQKHFQQISTSVNQLKRCIAYNPLQNVIRINSQKIGILKVELEKCCEATKIVINDIREYLVKIVEVMISQQAQDEDIEYIQHEDIDEKVFNINIKKPSYMEINEKQPKYKLEELQSLFQSLVKSEIVSNEVHIENQVSKLQQQIKFKQQIVKSIRGRSSSKGNGNYSIYDEVDEFRSDSLQKTSVICSEEEFINEQLAKKERSLSPKFRSNTGKGNKTPVNQAKLNNQKTGYKISNPVMKDQGEISNTSSPITNNSTTSKNETKFSRKISIDQKSKQKTSKDQYTNRNNHTILEDQSLLLSTSKSIKKQNPNVNILQDQSLLLQKSYMSKHEQQIKQLQKQIYKLQNQNNKLTKQLVLKAKQVQATQNAVVEQKNILQEKTKNLQSQLQQAIEKLNTKTHLSLSNINSLENQQNIKIYQLQSSQSFIISSSQINNRSKISNQSKQPQSKSISKKQLNQQNNIKLMQQAQFSALSDLQQELRKAKINISSLQKQLQDHKQLQIEHEKEYLMFIQASKENQQFKKKINEQSRLMQELRKSSAKEQKLGNQFKELEHNNQLLRQQHSKTIRQKQQIETLLESINARLQSTTKDLQSERKQFQVLKCQLQAEVHQLNSTNKTYINTLNQKINQLQSQFELQKIQYETKLQQKVMGLNQSNKALQETNKKLVRKNQELSQQNKKLSQANRKIHDQYNQLIKSNQQFQYNNKQLQQCNKALKQKIQILYIELLQKQQQIIKKDQQISHKILQFTNVIDQEQKTKIAEQQNQIQKIKQMLTRTNSQILLQLQDKSQQLESSNRKIQQYLHQIANLEQINEKMVQSLSNHEKELKHMTITVESQEKDIKQIKIINNNYQQRIKSLEIQLSEHVQSIQAITNESCQSTQLCKLREQQAEMLKLQTKKMQTIIQNVEQSHEAIKDQKQRINSKGQTNLLQIESLQQQIKTFMQQKLHYESQFNKDNKQKKFKIQQLEAQLQQALKSLKFRQEQLSDKSHTIQKLKTAIQLSQQKVFQLVQSIQNTTKLQQSINEAKSKNDSNASYIKKLIHQKQLNESKLNNQLIEKQSSIHELEVKVSSYIDLVNKLQEQIKKLQLQIVQRNSKLKELQDQVISKQSKINELTNCLDILQHQIKQLKTLSKDTTNSLQQSNNLSPHKLLKLKQQQIVILTQRIKQLQIQIQQQQNKIHNQKSSFNKEIPHQTTNYKQSQVQQEKIDIQKETLKSEINTLMKQHSVLVQKYQKSEEHILRYKLQQKDQEKLNHDLIQQCQSIKKLYEEEKVRNLQNTQFDVKNYIPLIKYKELKQWYEIAMRKSNELKSQNQRLKEDIKRLLSEYEQMRIQLQREKQQLQLQRKNKTSCTDKYGHKFQNIGSPSQLTTRSNRQHVSEFQPLRTDDQLIQGKYSEIRSIIQLVTSDMHLLQQKVKQSAVIQKVYLKQLDRKRTQNRKLRQEIEEYKARERKLGGVRTDRYFQKTGLHLQNAQKLSNHKPYLASGFHTSQQNSKVQSSQNHQYHSNTIGNTLPSGSSFKFVENKSTFSSNIHNADNRKA